MYMFHVEHVGSFRNRAIHPWEYVFVTQCSTGRSADVVVIGGGHAGIEAASATARMGFRTILVTMSTEAIGRLSCNPAIGGMAKGQLVREIDALGGEMARLADASGIQFKMLGLSKGPAMWSPRSQNDKDLYPQAAQIRLREIDGLSIIEDQVVDVRIENGCVSAAILMNEGVIVCRSVVVCSGTFLGGRLYTGMSSTPGGRIGEPAATDLSGSMRSVGFAIGRLKTGTPPRVDRKSVDFSLCRMDDGDPHPVPFSRYSSTVSNRISCFLTETTEETHDLLREGFDRSPIFQGVISGAGPRYCPSIEDKVARFADRASHQIFLEPEGVGSESIYVNGFSTSLPHDIQMRALRSIAPLRNARILRFGYAVEYDYFPSYQLDTTLQSKLVQGLFFAGQVNGTSGYEEAAAQGLMAGINCALRLRGDQPFLLGRSDAYVGVLIDDLVNLTIDEPYRMFTSRAEYRLLLRQDNADVRLTPLTARLGLVDPAELQRVEQKKSSVDRGTFLLKNVAVKPGHDRPHVEAASAWLLLKRPDVAVCDLQNWVAMGESDCSSELAMLLSDAQVAEQLDISAKYDGYLQRQQDDIQRCARLEQTPIPDGLDYTRITSLSSEAREKLNRIRPRSIGQASRIAGVSRSDLAVLTMYVR